MNRLIKSIFAPLLTIACGLLATVPQAQAAKTIPTPDNSRGGNAPPWKTMTLTGVVVNDLQGSRFVIRPNGNNFSYIVLALWGKPQNLSAGDKVRVFGAWHQGLLQAENVRVLREAARTKPEDDFFVPNRTITGVIAGAVGPQFMIRSGTSHLYAVRANQDLRDDLQERDLVRVYGDWRNLVLHARNIRVLERGHAQKIPPSQPGELTGTITDQPEQGQFRLRTDTGHIYWIRASWSDRFALGLGDMIHVRGTWQRGRLYAEALRRLRRGLAMSPVRYAHANRTLLGTVSANPTGNLFILRARNGFTYPVWATNGPPAGLTAGDQVWAHGSWHDGRLNASAVRILQQGRPLRIFQEHVLEGTVRQNQSGEHFTLRDLSGTSHRVLAVWGKPIGLKADDQVRAYGDWRKGTLHATSVRVLN